MLERQIPVACVQTQAYDRTQFSKHWPRVLAAVERACRSGAKLVVLPEGSVPSYVLGDEPVDERELAAAANDVATLARNERATIVYGGAKVVAGRTLNAAIAVGPGGNELGYAAKQFLWHFDRRWFAPGQTLQPIETPLGTIGLLVCADGRIPTIAATLVERGAELLVMPTAWVTSGRDPNNLENVQADLMANVRARENGVPFIVANKCGVELESVAYCGKSAIIDASGAFVTRASEREAAIVHGTVVGRAAHATPSAPLEGTATTLEVENRPVRARVAFAFADATEAERFGALALQADADVFVTFGDATVREGAPSGLARIAIAATGACEGIANAALPHAFVSCERLRSPRGLVHARLAGIDVFIVRADGDLDWNVRFARTRAAELRAFLLVFDAARGRAFAVDPDGVVIAGTFGQFRLPAFAYDATRTAATTVAPHTDVLAALRAAEALRAPLAASIA